jgi:hypothetical protein
MIRWSWLSALVFASACGDSYLRTNKSEYWVGEMVTLSLRNGEAEPMSYNLCAAQLEREIDGVWTFVEHDPASECPLTEPFAHSLNPVATAYARVPLAGDVSEVGTYQFVTEARLGEGRTYFFTTLPFEIVPLPEPR